VAELGL